MGATDGQVPRTSLLRARISSNKATVPAPAVSWGCGEPAVWEVLCWAVGLWGNWESFTAFPVALCLPLTHLWGKSLRDALLMGMEGCWTWTPMDLGWIYGKMYGTAKTTRTLSLVNTSDPWKSPSLPIDLNICDEAKFREGKKQRSLDSRWPSSKRLRCFWCGGFWPQRRCPSTPTYSSLTRRSVWDRCQKGHKISIIEILCKQCPLCNFQLL